MEDGCAETPACPVAHEMQIHLRHLSLAVVDSDTARKSSKRHDYADENKREPHPSQARHFSTLYFFFRLSSLHIIVMFIKVKASIPTIACAALPSTHG